MSNLLSKLTRLLPRDWRLVAELCAKIGLMTRAQVVILSALAILTVVTEVFGLFMILPILQFISEGRDIEKLAAQHKLWSVIADISAYTLIPVTLGSLCFVVFMLICVRQATQYAFTLYLARLQEKVVRALRSRTFDAMFQSRGAYLDGLGSGAFVNTIMSSCNFGGTAIGSLAKLGVVLLSFLAYGGGLFLVAPAITAIVMVAGLLLSYLMRYFRMSAERLSGIVIALNERFIQFLGERYRSWRLIKLSNANAVENEELKRQASAIGGMTVAIARNAALVQLLVNPAGALFMLAGLYLSVQYFNMTVAELTLFALIFLRIMPLTNTILAGRQQLATVAVNLAQAWTRLQEANAAREQIGGSKTFDRVAKDISCSDVTFRYPGEDTPALSHLDLNLPARAVIAITGRSGGGKSTLVDLFPRILVPDSGQIFFDGTDIKDFTLTSLRQGIAFVPQMPTLFQDTITENVKYGCPAATEADVALACHMAFVDEFVAEMPEGYQTRVGESGYKLSGGQRQRIALARAFLRRSSLLILDEPTSALDYHSEQRIKQAIEHYRDNDGATIIVITHRLSTIRGADHLVVLDKGRVVEQGAPKALSLAGEWFQQAAKLESI